MKSGKWIWKSTDDTDGYNEYVVARRRFAAGDVSSAQLSITADSWYRVFINGQWVHDGPCRSWSFRMQYDVLDVGGYLANGTNEILIIGRFFGTGVFQRDPQKGGMLAQLEVRTTNGEKWHLSTDSKWEVSKDNGWLVNTAKIGLGMEPFETFDARRDNHHFTKPDIVLPLNKGPWKNLHPRDVELLTRKTVAPISFRGASVVNRDWQGYTFPLIRLLYPGLIEGEGFTCMASVAATLLIAGEETTIGVESYPSAEGPTLIVNGDVGANGQVKLAKGENLVLLLFEPWGHHNKEQGVRFIHDKSLLLKNPTDPTLSNPWDFIPFEELKYHEHDKPFMGYDPPDRKKIKERIQEKYRDIAGKVTNPESYREILSPNRMEPCDRFPVENPHWQFESRRVLPNISPRIDQPQAPISDGIQCATIFPASEGDLELCYDLGEQNCGYYEFELEAGAGTIIDIFGIEYICREKGIQHTWSNKNGMRYICRGGKNHYLSLKRRSGRYLYLTIRNQTSAVKLRKLRLVESTFPVRKVGAFECDDAQLNRIWEISERTLKLCMEDVFTDCPLYEQTLWVGDARNEGLFAMTVYRDVGNIIKRCIRLAGHGLERMPIIPSHVPTSNSEAVLPAWAFLWGLSIWDYYYYSGDEAFLHEIWPFVVRNLEQTRNFINERGLFSGPFWNMFDWTGIDSGHMAVTHNSMLLKGSLDALARCAEVIKDEAIHTQLREWSIQLTDAINTLWDDQLESYIDSIHDDGAPSGDTCIHTNMLALLYDIVPEAQRARALGNVLNPPEGMTTIGSPFTMLYLYEMLDKLGHHDEIIASIQTSYTAMLEVDATTVWEQFPDGNAYNPDGFPTRSHCHAWSSSPLHFLNLLILGIRQAGVGGKHFTISPRINHHEKARGATACIHGAIRVEWTREDGTLDIQVQTPVGVTYQFLRNETMADYAIRLNGQELHEESSRILPAENL